MDREQARAIIKAMRHGHRDGQPRKRIDRDEWKAILGELWDLVGAVVKGAIDGKITADEASAIAVQLTELGKAVSSAKAD